MRINIGNEIEAEFLDGFLVLYGTALSAGAGKLMPVEMHIDAEQWAKIHDILHDAHKQIWGFVEVGQKGG